MTDAQIAPSQAQYERLHVLMDVVDTVRHAQEDAARAAGEALDDDALVAQVLRIYAQQGLEVDEATARKGLEMMRSRRFEFTAPADTLAVRLARLYASRAAWGPKALVAGGATAVAALLLAGTVLVAGLVRQGQWMDEATASVREHARAQAQARELGERAQALPLTPASVMAAGQAASRELVQARAAVAALPALPGDEGALKDYYESNPDRARQVLARRQQGMAQAGRHLASATEQLGRAALIQAAAAKAGILENPVAPHLEGYRAGQRLAYARAADRGDPGGMQAALEALERALSLDLQREALAAQARDVPGGGTAVDGLLEESRGALAAGNLDGASALLGDVASRLEILPLSYTLRIVSEPGEKTGVWRYYGNDRSKKSFYIVVDALDASGNRVELPVRSIEDQSLVRASRLAIRVPESVYKAVGEDKARDGIVDDAVFAQKRAGEIEPEYRFGTLGGAITHW